ncbi:MAG: hypothetical protein IJW72_00165 [Alphaproteobacteria bacterium]|nr:hypothetical protein [Alphaproteobacteria bacterium]
MNQQEELANALQEALSPLLFDGQEIHYYFGRVNSVEYPFINIYFSNFRADIMEAARYKDINATCVVEFAYASTTEDDKLYEFMEKMENKLLPGFQYTRREHKCFIKTDSFESNIVDGFGQLVFDLNYQIDTEVKIDNDNLDKMETLALDLTKSEK